MESQGIAQHYSQIEKIDLQMQQTAHKKQLLYLIKDRILLHILDSSKLFARIQM